jgi:hypothetical protein
MALGSWTCGLPLPRKLDDLRCKSSNGVSMRMKKFTKEQNIKVLNEVEVEAKVLVY